VAVLQDATQGVDVVVHLDMLTFLGVSLLRCLANVWETTSCSND
jgi:hypothetical protein